MHRQLVAPSRPGRHRRWPRAASVRHLDPTAPERVVRLADLALRGLLTGYDPVTRVVRPDRARRLRRPRGQRPSPRARACATRRWRRWGSAGCPRWPSCAVLDGRTAAEVAGRDRRAGASSSDDPGAVALALWAAGRGRRPGPAALLDRLGEHLRRGRPARRRSTLAWMLTAAVAAARRTPTPPSSSTGAPRLLRRYHGPGGTYPHVLPPRLPVALASPRRQLRRPGLPAAGARPRRRARRATPWLLEYAEPHGRRDLRRCRARPASGGGTTTAATAASSSATRSTASTSTRWPRWRSSTCGRRAATTTAREIVAGLGWIDAHPEVVEELVDRALRPGLAQGRAPRAAQGGPRARRRHHVGVAGLHRARASTGSARRWRSTTSAAPTSSGWLLYAWLAPPSRGDDRRSTMRDTTSPRPAHLVRAGGRRPDAWPQTVAARRAGRPARTSGC